MHKQILINITITFTFSSSKTISKFVYFIVSNNINAEVFRAFQTCMMELFAENL